jgi:hypothetical protein
MLYHILFDAPRSTYDPRKNLGHHVDGIVGSANVKSLDSVTSHLKELYLNESAGGPALSVSSNPTQSMNIHSVQLSADPNGNQQPGGNKNKARNNCKGGKNNNKPKENGNNEKTNNNVGEGKRERCKVKFPYKLCIDDHLTHLFPKLAEAMRLLSLPPVVLKNYFPHNQHMASNSSNAKNAAGGSQNPPLQDNDHLCINIVDKKVNVATRSRYYISSQAIPGLESPPPPLEMTLQIEKPEPLSHILKGVLNLSTHNPNVRATQNYSIVEDLGQTPYAMSALEVPQTCPSQRNALLSTLGAIEPIGSKVIKFDILDVKPHLPYHVAFQIHVGYSKYTIKHVVVDEGVATCVMSLIYWKSLSFLTLSKSSNMLTSFDDHSFHPHGILPAFPVQIGGKMVEVEVKVVDVPLDYNLLLGYNWTYDMVVIVSFIFCTLCFPHEGNIVMIDQLSFAYASPNAFVGSSIPVIDNYQPTTRNGGVRMYSSLMGTFELMSPIHHVYTMSSRLVSMGRSIPFCTSYFSDPWSLLSLTSSYEA